MARWAVLVGLVGGAGAVALTLSSDHVRYRWGDALFLADNIAGFSAAGAYWLVRRPASLLGPALLCDRRNVGAGRAPERRRLARLQPGGAGRLARRRVATFFTLLAFPSGRLTGRLDRAVVVLVFAASPCSSSRTCSSRRSRRARHPLAECAGGCARECASGRIHLPGRRWSTSARPRRSVARSSERSCASSWCAGFAPARGRAAARSSGSWSSGCRTRRCSRSAS